MWKPILDPEMTLCACAPNYAVWNKKDFPASLIKANISSLKIEDHRSNTQKIAFKKGDWFGKFAFDKELSKQDSGAIFQEVARNFVPGETELEISIKISEANVEFENTGLRERWRGKFRIRMIFYGKSGKSYCEGEASIFRSGGMFLKVKPVLEKLFEEGMILSSYKCIEAWKKEANLGRSQAVRN